MKAVAFANANVIFIAWDSGKPIPDCLGMSVHLIEQDAQGKVVKEFALPSFMSFKKAAGKGGSDSGKDTAGAGAGTTTDDSPIQGVKWKYFGGQPGKSYAVKVIPVLGTPDKHSLALEQAAVSNVVTLSTKCGDFVDACFNMGMLSTQKLLKMLPAKADGSPDVEYLMKAIATPGDPIRVMLAGQMPEFLKTLLVEAKAQGGVCHDALYELSDPELVQFYLDNLPFFEMVLSNTGADDATNKPAREKLHGAGAKVTDRFLDGTSIGHNKSSTLILPKVGPTKVMGGSINRTSTGLCTQTNNAVIIASQELARLYEAYWQALKADSAAHPTQSAAFRAMNGKRLPDVVLPDGTTITAWFSPNTADRSKPKTNPPTPPDMAEVFGYMDRAKSALYYLAFYPGFPSIVSKVDDMQKTRPDLFYRGAVSSTQALPRDKFAVSGTKSGIGEGGVALVHHGEAPVIIAASAIEEQISRWHKEILKLPDAHAIIHDKVLVIDPLAEDPMDCVVVITSHNLGFKASYENDENMLIIRGNRKLAMAYMVHVLDVYDHYRFRYLLATHQSDFSGFLEPTAAWQDKYFGDTSARKELLYWVNGAKFIR